MIYLGTFSKILAPGYRLGWVNASDEILDGYNKIAQAAALQASTISQMETAKWIDMFDLDAHVAQIREVYGKRRQVMLDTMEATFPEGVKWTHPDGGLFLWVTLPEGMKSQDVYMKALEKNVAFVPGDTFFPNGGVFNCFRMNYSCMPEDKIKQGITALAETIKELM